MCKDDGIIQQNKNKIIITYWEWFFFGSGGKPGITKLINTWLVVHYAIGLLLTLIVDKKISEVANTLLLPLLGIFVGLSFSWASTVYPIMQIKEIDLMVQQTSGGFEEYIYTFQTAVLVMLITLLAWGLVGLDIHVKIITDNMILIFITKISLYTLVSLSIRECWQVVVGIQLLFLAQKNINKNIN